MVYPGTAASPSLSSTRAVLPTAEHLSSWGLYILWCCAAKFLKLNYHTALYFFLFGLRCQINTHKPRGWIKCHCVCWGQGRLKVGAGYTEADKYSVWHCLLVTEESVTSRQPLLLPSCFSSMWLKQKKLVCFLCSGSWRQVIIKRLFEPMYIQCINRS